jgi:hypothetical protein
MASPLPSHPSPSPSPSLTFPPPPLCLLSLHEAHAGSAVARARCPACSAVPRRWPLSCLCLPAARKNLRPHSFLKTSGTHAQSAKCVARCRQGPHRTDRVSVQPPHAFAACLGHGRAPCRRGCVQSTGVVPVVCAAHHKIHRDSAAHRVCSVPGRRRAPVPAPAPARHRGGARRPTLRGAVFGHGVGRGRWGSALLCACHRRCRRTTQCPTRGRRPLPRDHRHLRWRCRGGV